MIAHFGQRLSYGLLVLVTLALVALTAVPLRAAPYADLVIDARTGEVLHSENADTRLHPASLTKMMTLYIAFEAIERGEITLDTMATISSHAAAEPPSKLGMKPGQRIAMRYLIRAAAVKSANDAATAIGENISGSEAAFARRMNRTAKALGMTRTTFKNAHGLTEAGHMSTARDMTLLGRRLLYDFPQYYNLFSRRTADAGVAQVSHTNRRFLESYKGADGIKTGYTSAAGFNLVASAERGKKRIIVTVFGGRSTATRNARVTELMDMGFGMAPNRAKVQKPAPPVYTAEAMGEPTDDPRGVGKKIRVNGTVAKSPRPRARPDAASPPAAEMLLAMQDGINSALAEVQSGPATAPQPDPAAEALRLAAIAAAEASAAETPDMALATATADTDAAVAAALAEVRTTAPQPETLALAATADTALPTGQALASPVAAATPDVAEVAAAQPLAVVASVVPMPRPEPETPADAPVQTAAIATAIVDAVATDAARDVALVVAGVAEAVPASTPEIAHPLLDPATQLSDAPPAALALAGAQAAPPTRPGEGAAPAGGPAPVMLAAQITPEPQPDTLIFASAFATPQPQPGAESAVVPTVVAPPPARPAEIVLAAANATDLIAPDQEIVTRVSTSGGRHFAISVGRFGSRYEAERVLLKTALIEIDTLSDGLRKVVPRKGGFEANFVGLSEQTAALACQRLSARGGDCKVISP